MSISITVHEPTAREAIENAFDAAKAAGKPTKTVHRAKEWQIDIPVVDRPITEGRQVVNETSVDGRTSYHFEAVTKRISKKTAETRTFLRLRRSPAKVKGKAAVKAAKRARQQERAA